jgi:hypothetical protein
MMNPLEPTLFSSFSNQKVPPGLHKLALAGRIARLLAAFCLSQVGCIKRPHLYPVCFYQSAPTQQRVQEYYSIQLLSVLQISIGASAQTKASISPDGRWLVADVTKRQDAKVAGIWPRVGCLGNALDGLTTKQEADCVAYVRLFVTTHRYFEFGNAKDAGGIDIWNESLAPGTLVHCHQVKEDEQPHTAVPSGQASVSKRNIWSWLRTGQKSGR